MTEAEMAELRASDGMTVVESNGHYWAAIFPGFYQPVHLLARLEIEAVRRPTAFCWGYRAALRETDAGRTNGSVPVHLKRAEAFDASRMSGDRRRNLNRCRRKVELIRSRDPALLEQHGYPVFRSAQDRLHYWREASAPDYRRDIGARVRDDRRLFVVGLVDGKVGGYLESYVVDGVLYTHELIVATDVMKTGINTGLYVETIEIAKRAGTVRDICLGLDTPERPGLTEFKLSLGFPIVHVPARSSIPAPIGAYIRARRPAVHYRLTGLPRSTSGPQAGE